MSWPLPLILGSWAETDSWRRGRAAVWRLLWAIAARWLAETFRKSPAASRKHRANITAQAQGSQTKQRPRIHGRLFTWMPFRRAHSPSHLIRGDFESHRLWARQLPRLGRGGETPFILCIYSLKSLRKEVLTCLHSLRFSGQLWNVNRRRFRC